MKKLVRQLVLALPLIALALHGVEAQSLHLYDLKEHQVLKDKKAVQALSHARIILVGEQHDNPRHHQAQLIVIQALQQAGRKPAVAMEMFRADGQADLDQWVAGKIDEARFKPIYQDHWSDSWSLYAPIFLYARKNRIPMVGLNVSRSITLQVAYHGFASLNKEQRGQLEGVTCDVSQDYRDYIQRAYGGHGHGDMNFERFCEAQLVWDTTMAIHANIYASQHADRTVVILTGSGHARKQGIPAQLKKLDAPASTVILPWSEAMDITTEEADYIFIFD